MINILTFRLFEENQEVSSEKSFAEFDSVMNKFRFSNVLKSWIRFEKKKTGRIYLHSNYLPSVSYLKKLRDDENLWFYTRVSQGENYGMRTGSLEEVLRGIIWDCIRKALPTGMPPKKADAIVNSEGWMEKNLNSDMEAIVSKIREEMFSKVGNIGDLSDLSTPLMKKLGDINAIKITRRKSQGSVDISVNGDFAIDLLHDLYPEIAYKRTQNLYWIQIIPSLDSGIKKIAGGRGSYYNVKVGVKKMEDCYKRIDSIIRDMFFRLEDSDFFTGFIKHIIDLPGTRVDIIKELSVYCGKDIEKIAAIKNPETRKKIIKMNDMEGFDRIINLHSDGLI